MENRSQHRETEEIVSVIIRRLLTAPVYSGIKTILLRNRGFWDRLYIETEYTRDR